MPFITMTAEQTAIYDGDDDAAIRGLLADLRSEAQDTADRTGKACDIYTDDGIVALSIEPTPERIDYSSRAVASIYNEDGYTITTGLQPSRYCDEALITARAVAAERCEPVILEDDDGDWIVSPDGSVDEVQS